MKTKYPLNHEWMERQLAIELDSIHEGQKNIREKLYKDAQTTFLFHGMHYKNAALLLHALNGSENDVLHYFNEAAGNYWKVLELRDRQNVPHNIISDRMELPPWEADPIENPELFKADYSLTNSSYSLDFASAGAIAGNFNLRDKILEKAWDPENAGYIGELSDVCTWDEHYLAYALRELVVNNKDKALGLVRKIKGGKTDNFSLKAMTENLILEDKESFVFNLISLVDFQQDELETHPTNFDLYISLRGMGLYSIALTRGLIKANEVKIESSLLPIQYLK